MDEASFSKETEKKAVIPQRAPPPPTMQQAE